MRGHDRFWREQRGSTALTLCWFMLVALSFAIGLDGLFGAYIALQQGYTAGDAAVLAAARSISEFLPQAVEEEAALRVQHLVSDEIARKAIQAGLEALNESQNGCALLAPLCTPMTPQERQEAEQRIASEAYRAAFDRLYRGSLSQEMSLMIARGIWEQADSVQKRDLLVPDDTDFGCLIQRVAQQRRQEILQEAERLAQANGANLDWERSELAQPNGLFTLVTDRTVRPFGIEWIFPDGSDPKLYIPNIAMLSRVGQRSPQYLPSC